MEGSVFEYQTRYIYFLFFMLIVAFEVFYILASDERNSVFYLSLTILLITPPSAGYFPAG